MALDARDRAARRRDRPTACRPHGGDAAVSPDAVAHALRRIIHAVDVHSRDLLARWGLTTPQLLVLREIGARGATTGNALARAVSLSPATMAGILARLGDRSLVRRRPDPDDRRQVLISLTGDGEGLLATAPPPLQIGFSQRFAALAPGEQGEILAVLDRLVAMMALADEPAD